MDFLTELDNLWPQSDQLFVLGLVSGLSVSLLVFVLAILTGKVKL